MTNNDAATPAVHTALDELRKIKAPTKRAAFVAGTIVALATQDEVNEFTRRVRLAEKVQDVALLPECDWNIRRWESGNLVEPTDATTAELRIVLRSAERVRIDFPSILFHYGFGVDFEIDGHAYVAQTTDYRMTETYMSM